MHRIKALALLSLTTLLLSACVYKLGIQQGNNLDQKDIDQLRPGLTKNQVVFVLGTPVMKDGFSDDKWVYLYSYKNPNKVEDSKERRLTVFFEGDNLVSAASNDYDIPEALISSNTPTRPKIE
jgi:outer membrane protein assembly factor BamE